METTDILFSFALFLRLFQPYSEPLVNFPARGTPG
jgi:hypothetical protein